MPERNRNASSSIGEKIISSVVDTAIKYIIFPIVLLIVLTIHSVRSVDSPVRHFAISIARPALTSMLSSEDAFTTPSPVAQLSPTPTVTQTPTSIPIATATPRLPPTLIPPPTPTPTPTRTVEGVRATLISLRDQALRRQYNNDRDAGLNIVVKDAVYYGQYDIALDAAKRGGWASNKSSMLAYVAECMAREEWYEWARHAADHIPILSLKQLLEKRYLTWNISLSKIRPRHYAGK